MGYGPAIPPLTGLAAATGYLDGQAEELGLSMPDPTAGISAAWGIVAALERVNQTGNGEHLDVSLWEATAVLNAEAWMHFQAHGETPTPNGNRSTRMAPHGIFPCAGEDQWIAIACQNDSAWQTLRKQIDPDNSLGFSHLNTLSQRQAQEAEIESALAQWTGSQDRWALTEQLQAQGIAAFPTLSCADVIHDPHLNERGFIERLEHPEVGRRAHAGIPWRLAQRPDGVQRPAPCLGQDTERLLQEILGKSNVDIKQLKQQGALNL